jgi:hypothetical protein
VETALCGPSTYTAKWVYITPILTHARPEIHHIDDTAALENPCKSGQKEFSYNSAIIARINVGNNMRRRLCHNDDNREGRVCDN